MVVRPKHYGALRNDLSHQIFCMQTDILGSSRINVRYWRTYSSGRNGNRSGAAQHDRNHYHPVAPGGVCKKAN